MSEHFFGGGRGKVSEAKADKIDRIARKHGATFVSVNLPGDGPRFWFACPNRGEPFDSRTAREVLAAVEHAGLTSALWPKD